MPQQEQQEQQALVRTVTRPLLTVQDIAQVAQVAWSASPWPTWARCYTQRDHCLHGQQAPALSVADRLA